MELEWRADVRQDSPDPGQTDRINSVVQPPEPNVRDLARDIARPGEPQTKIPRLRRKQSRAVLAMLVTPHVYRLSRNQPASSTSLLTYHAPITVWGYNAEDYRHAANMLLLHQTGSVRVGEVVRYTLTYTPSADRILPAPSLLHVKIKNTSAIPLRAAYLHGPYTLYVACYPSTFDPNQKHINVKQEGAPEYEPNLKAGGHWTAKLKVPEEIRKTAGESHSRQTLDYDCKSFTWIIEVSSQVLFSTTAAVHYELLVGRDEKSVDLGFHGVVGSGQGAPGKLEDHQQGRRRNAAQPKGVFSKAVRLAVDDTESLWNTPAFPSWDEAGNVSSEDGPHHGDKRDAGAKQDPGAKQGDKPRKQQKIHLVVLTHGLHSNLGADMLFVKESIDTAAKQAREDARERRAELRRHKIQEQNQFDRDAADQRTKSAPEIAIAPTNITSQSDDEDDEQVIVRGFNGNAVKTERGIQYLGKRLAKYVLSITYPDQPYLPVKSSISKSITRSFTGQKLTDKAGTPTHKNSSIVKDLQHINYNLAYKITSISFVSHSLGGLIQTYAIAYIQKHSPEFFDRIEPINFVAMASPFLGLSNENPMYVRFALDFGLVGRTGQDLGLTWRTPTIARSSWEAVIGGLGQDARKAQGQGDPGAKPLLRILPTGPAHTALKRFRNRSVYSNVVNDGIVPLRTSCLLFLDWRGLGRVEKARRENGLVGTMVGWGWAEMTGQNASSLKRPLWNDIFGDSGDDRSDSGRTGSPDPGHEVPQAEAGEGMDEEEAEMLEKRQSTDQKPYQEEVYDQAKAQQSPVQSSSAWSGFLSMFKPQPGTKSHHLTPKSQRIYKRGQTATDERGSADSDSPEEAARRGLVRGSSLYTVNSETGELAAPPKTTFFESAGDILNPPLPPKEFLLDPAARPRTIFHDRVYHPQDIPEPPVKRQRTFMRRNGSREDSIPKQSNSETSRISDSSIDNVDPAPMKIEEKIARAYHKDLSWRKVLVRLEPDAHNNMIVRRMFANAYGWPVVKHLCDTHFAFTAAAQTRDDEEEAVERAKPADIGVDVGGEQVEGQVDPPDEGRIQPQEEADHRSKSLEDVHSKAKPDVDVNTIRQNLQQLNLKTRKFSARTESEIRESNDEVSELASPATTTATASNSYSSKMGSGRGSLNKLPRLDSAKWSDKFFEGSEDESEDDEGYMQEWRKAKARGEGGAKKDVPKSAAKAIVPVSDGPLTASPKASVSDLRKEGQTVPGDGISSDLQTLALTGVGLGKSVDEQVVRPRKGGTGVAENVAVASSQGKG